MGSVSQIGWEWYSRLSREASVTLVTHVRNRESLVAAGAPLPGSEVIYIDTEWFAGPLFRLASRLFPRSQHAVFLLSSADFFVYDGAALKQLKKRRGDWDLIHAVTPVSPLAATRLHRLGIPLIVGPWNGGLPSPPPAFPEVMRDDPSWVYRIRVIGRLLDRFFGSTRNAALILTATRFTQQSLPPGVRTLHMIENGVDLERFRPGEKADTRPGSDPIRVLFVGRLLPSKGVGLLLEAVALVCREIPIHLSVIGDGPCRAELERQAAERGLSGIVHFTGERSLPEVAESMRRADVFCLPSIRESGGAVLLEAEASGVPVIAVDSGGPAELVDDEVGRKIPAEDPKRLVEGLAAALRDIARNREQWRQRGIKGRRRAERLYGWNAKISRALTIYRQVLGRESQGDRVHA
jgi:glycosyltransferase involved in cell wall biosynthesis